MASFTSDMGSLSVGWNCVTRAIYAYRWRSTSGTAAQELCDRAPLAGPHGTAPGRASHVHAFAALGGDPLLEGDLAITAGIGSDSPGRMHDPLRGRLCRYCSLPDGPRAPRAQVRTA